VEACGRRIGARKIATLGTDYVMAKKTTPSARSQDLGIRIQSWEMENW
jgi:hypothetical protein